MSTRYSLCTFNESDCFLDFIDSEDDFIVYYHLISILVYLSFIASFVAIFLMATVGIIPIEDFVNSKRNDLFSLDTFVEIFAFFGIYYHRGIIFKTLFNVYSFTLNLLIFIPYICIILVLYSIHSIMVVLMAAIAYSWGFKPDFSELWLDWDDTKNNFLIKSKKYNGIHRTAPENNEEAEE